MSAHLFDQTERAYGILIQFNSLSLIMFFVVLKNFAIYNLNGKARSGFNIRNF